MQCCERCGLSYDDMRTGLTFRDVFSMLWVDNPDPRCWLHKRRHTVLGLWHQIKRELWAEHLGGCDGRQLPARN